LSKIIGGAEIRFAAERLLAQAHELESGWEATQLYRDGLFMLIAIYAPERRRALATIRLSQIDLARGVIRFEPSQIKTVGPRERFLPEHVLTRLDAWIEVWRARSAKAHDCLWIAKGAGVPNDTTLAAAFANATERELGLRLSIHRVRDAAATLIVEKSPDRVPLAGRSSASDPSG
jgi:integrase